jgi:hypothetical protein
MAWLGLSSAGCPPNPTPGPGLPGPLPKPCVVKEMMGSKHPNTHEKAAGLRNKQSQQVNGPRGLLFYFF